MSRYAGLSPLVAREIAHLADGESEGLWRFFDEVVRRIRENDFTPTLLLKPDGVPLEYAFLPITQYGNDALCRVEESFSRLIETFFSERSRNERIRQRASDILRLLTASETRLTKKLAAQEVDLAACKGVQGFSVTALLEAVGMGGAKLEGTVLTIDGQTSAILS
jgi:predicted ribosome quality control (RQC) complex YloA/Tae2 family protein